MSTKFCKARVMETTITEGSEAVLQLLGAPQGYQSFWQAFGQSGGANQSCYYAIHDQEGWEYGIGVINSASQLTRTLVIAIGYTAFNVAPATLGEGIKNVYCAIPPEAVHMRGSVPLTLNDSTPDLLGGNVFVEANNLTTTIVSFDSGVIDGKVITILFTTGNTTIQHNSNIKLVGGSNFTGTANDTLRLVCIGGVCYEKSRSVNA